MTIVLGVCIGATLALLPAVWVEIRNWRERRAIRRAAVAAFDAEFDDAA